MQGPIPIIVVVRTEMLPASLHLVPGGLIKHHSHVVLATDPRCNFNLKEVTQKIGIRMYLTIIRDDLTHIYIISKIQISLDQSKSTVLVNFNRHSHEKMNYITKGREYFRERLNNTLGYY